MLDAGLRLGANPPRRLGKSILLNNTTSKTRAPLFSRADRRGQVQRLVGRHSLDYRHPMTSPLHTAFTPKDRRIPNPEKLSIVNYRL